MIVWLLCPRCLPSSVHLWPPFVSVCPRRRGQVSACPPSGRAQRATVCPAGQWSWLPPVLPPVTAPPGTEATSGDSVTFLLPQVGARVNGNNAKCSILLHLMRKTQERFWHQENIIVINNQLFKGSFHVFCGYQLSLSLRGIKLKGSHRG